MITQNNFAIPLECYSRLKSNRKLIYQGVEMKVSELDQLFPITSFNHKHGAYIKAVEVFLLDYGDLQLLLVRKDTHAEPGKTKYIFSTDLFVSASQILLRYRSRWAIETIFRDMKQNLNLGSCQTISLDAQESHLALAIFGFVLLELLPALEFQGHVYRSIGDYLELRGYIEVWLEVEELDEEETTSLEELLR